jgi:hypothetical protein
LAVKTLLASLVLGAAALGSTLPASADVLPASFTANDSDMVGYFPGGLSGYLTLNWQDAYPNVGLVQFNLSSYAPGSVSSAVLDLYQLYNSAQGAQYGIFRNTSAWVGVTTDFASRPGTDSLPSAVLTLPDPNSFVHRTIDITPLVQGWVNGDYANNGLTLQRLDDPNPLVYFIASDSSGYPAPVLLINAVPEPETVAMLLAGLGMLVVLRRRSVA